MPSYELTLKDFLIELKRWKLTKEYSLYRVKREDLNSFWRFSFCLPNTNEEYITSVRKEELSKVEAMDLMNSIPVIRLSDNVNAANLIVNKLDEVNNANTVKASEGKDL